MKLIVEITKALRAQQYVTTYYYGKATIAYVINNILKNSDSDCRLIKLMKLKMKKNLHDHYAVLYLIC